MAPFGKSGSRHAQNDQEQRDERDRRRHTAPLTSVIRFDAAQYDSSYSRTELRCRESKQHVQLWCYQLDGWSRCKLTIGRREFAILHELHRARLPTQTDVDTERASRVQRLTVTMVVVQSEGDRFEPIRIFRLHSLQPAAHPRTQR